MLQTDEILSTIEMLHAEHLDVRAVTLALNVNDCAAPNINHLCRKLHSKITSQANRLVEICDRVGVKYGAFRGSPARSYHHLHIRHGYPLVLPRTVPVWRPHVQPSYVWRHGDHLHLEPARVYPHPVYPVYPVAPPVYRIYRR